MIRLYRIPVENNCCNNNQCLYCDIKNDLFYYYVLCEKCNKRTKNHDTIKKALTEWNKNKRGVK